jgi:hypothetical protein
MKRLQSSLIFADGDKFYNDVSDTATSEGGERKRGWDTFSALHIVVSIVIIIKTRKRVAIPAAHFLVFGQPWRQLKR